MVGLVALSDSIPYQRSARCERVICRFFLFKFSCRFSIVPVVTRMKCISVLRLSALGDYTRTPAV